MSKNLKKYISIVALYFMISAVVFPGIGFSQTASTADLMAQIQALQAQLIQLQAQLNALTGTGAIPAACAGISFTRNLTLGSNGTDVRCLQALLNSGADTQVAVTGPGSPGNETLVFGPLTRAAVIRFQLKYASVILTPLGLVNGTGFVGASTRLKLGALLAVTPPVTPPPAAGDTIGGIVINGTEGDLTVTANAAPANGMKVYEGDDKDTVAGINIKATGSDISVQRVTLEFDKRPYNFFDNIYLYDGSTLIAKSVLDSDTVTRVTANKYTVTLSNFQNNFVVKKDNTKTMNVKVDVLSSISSDILPGTSTNVVMNVASNGVRAIDQANLSIFDPGSAATVARTINVNESLSSSASLVVSRASDTPSSGNLVADNNNSINDATLLKFNIRAQRGAVTIDEINSIAFTTGSGFLVPATAYLYSDSGNVLASATPSQSTGLVDFTDLSVNIGANSTVELSIKIDDTIAGNGSENGDKYRVTVTAASGSTEYIVAQRSNGSLLDSSDLMGSATSFDQFAFTNGALFTLTNVSTSTTPKTDSAQSTISARFTIQVNAQGSDIFVAKNGAFKVYAVLNNNAPGTLVGSTVYSRPSQVTELDNSYEIPQDTTATFVVNSTYVLAGTAGNYDLRVEEIDWGTSDSNPAANHSTYMANDFISDIVFLQ